MNRGGLFLTLCRAQWLAHPLRHATSALALALGVALGYAVHIVNEAAMSEFAAALDTVGGGADVEIRGPAAGFDDRLYDAIAVLPGVAAVAPVLELDVRRAGATGQGTASLRLYGVDVLTAAELTPALVGRALSEEPLALLSSGVFLSAAALSAFGVVPGDTIELVAGDRAVALRIAGDLPMARSGQILGAMDIAAAQDAFRWTGRINRIDVILAPGVRRAEFTARARALLPAGTLLAQPQDSLARSANVSRAYRVNLTVLALVALFTGAFLVFATQALSIVRRRAQIALLRVLGLTERELLREIIMEGGLLGLVGGVLGVVLGYGAAALLLDIAGPDLGGGYFLGLPAEPQFSATAAGAAVLLAIATALAGSLAPAIEAARASPAMALRAGDEELPLARMARMVPALLLIGLGAALAWFAPPLAGLPVAGYAAIALLLVGGLMLMPGLARTLFAGLAKYRWRALPLDLALARLAGAPGQAAAVLSGILASFALMIAMLIMVSSFRMAVGEWLDRVLPADIYVRPAGGAETSWLSDAERAALVAAARRVEFSRVTSLSLDPRRPPVSLIARPLQVADAPRLLALSGPQQQVAGERPVWVSEAMVALYGMRPGDVVDLPLAGSYARFTVAGVWRDYARQFGAVVVRHEDYVSLTGDRTLTDAALWLAEGESAETIVTRLRAQPGLADRLQVMSAGAIRAQSLELFDRSFAVSYVLTAAAILIGLFTIAAGFSAQVLARAREFGMLRHLGVTRSEIVGVLATEGLLVSALGAAAGLAWGVMVSIVLVYVVNPQSFHWSMELRIPWTVVLPVIATVLLTGTLTATLAGGRALSADVVRSVRDDW